MAKTIVLFSDIENEVGEGSELASLMKGLHSSFEICSWKTQHQFELGAQTKMSSNSIGYVFSGDGFLQANGREFPLSAGMCFSTGEGSRIVGVSGIAVTQHGYKGMFQIGGPIEKIGRLKYIDGCSDTLLIPPLVKGDACLNFLHLPAGTEQTFHTHPSFRFGMIVCGSGYCDSGDSNTRTNQHPSQINVEELYPGKIFLIPPEGLHRFRTTNKMLSVIAFHPDSDFGPDDDNHPMVNKTMVDGIPASQLSYDQRGIKHARFEETAK